MKLYDYLLDAAREEPERTCLEFMGHKFSYGYVAQEAKMVATGLARLGVKPGESVACMLPNIPPFVSVHYGTLLRGSVFVPFNVMLKAPEIAYQSADSQVRVIVTYELFLDEVRAGIADLPNPPEVFVVGHNWGEFHPWLELLAEVDDSFEPIKVDDQLPIMTLYTSGTTGKAKGAQITNANIIANIKMFDEVLPNDPDDKALCVLPLFHCFALNGVLNAGIYARTCTVLHPRFDVEACLHSLANDRITSFAGVPTMYFYLLKHPKLAEMKFPNLKYCVSGGAAMPMEVMNQWEKATGVPIIEGFGMTETTVSVCINRQDDRRAGSIGKPFAGVEMRIFDDNDRELPSGDVGELVIRGPNILLGYLNKPAETAESLRGDWFHTGDLGYRDADGFFYIVDRKKDMIIKGGFNIYPREIEEVIYQLPQVAEAAVIGVFDEAKGEVVRAVVALKAGQSLSEEQLHAHLDANLAKYKLPTDYAFVAELPKGPTGKILKRELCPASEQWNRDRIRPQAEEALA